MNRLGRVLRASVPRRLGRTLRGDSTADPISTRGYVWGVKVIFIPHNTHLNTYTLTHVPYTMIPMHHAHHAHGISRTYK